MRRILRVLTSTTFLVLFFTTLLALTIWFLGPVLGAAGIYPLEGVLARVIAIALIYLLAIIAILVTLLRRRRTEAGMVEAITAESAEDPADAAARAEIAELRTRMREALALLRRSRLGGRFGRRHVYQLPWYIIIGPPGAGKTTAIIRSGLQFPLADRMGLKPVGGVGGTRNCDWWFTNEAVLIDTAGRYTTQDSDETADARAWSGFLDILKRYRPRQPVNGAMVAISLSDLSLLDETTRRAHAAAIRKRLSELRERLGVRFPVYVLFTKADLIAGFQEFFDNLGREEREQVWGFTLPLPGKEGGPPPAEAFDAEFDLLLERLNDLSLERMQQETDPERRSLIQSFPLQVASLREVARDFLAEVFVESRFEERPLMRGVYLASGTQEGTPIDRLMTGMARAFGIGRQAIGAGQGQGRSYFLHRLLTDVIFSEAGLVSADDRVERRWRWILRGGVAAAILVLAGFGAAWTASFLGNRALVAEAAAKLDRYRQLVGGIKVNPVSDSDIASVVPALNVLRELPGNPAAGAAAPPISLTWGLYQGDAIGTEAAQAYRAALNQLLLPRLLLRLEEQMQANLNDPDLLFELLKAYLMLGLQGPIDRDFLTAWFQADIQVTWPGDQNARLRKDLAFHLDRLIHQPMQKIALNGPLVDQVQKILAETPIAERIYRSIITSPAAKALPDWRVIDAGGPTTARVLVRPSGEPLSGGVEGIYTWRGFRTVFLPEAGDVATRIARESWILGPHAGEVASEANLPNIARDVMNLYLNDYVAKWERILGDLDIVPIANLAQAVEVTNILSGPTSPIANILMSVSQETRLTEERKAVDVDAAKRDTAGFAVEEAMLNLTARQQTFVNLARRAAPGLSIEKPDAPPGQYVEDRFAWLHEFTNRPEGQKSQLDLVLETLAAVYQELNRLSIQGIAPNLNPGQGGAMERLLEATGRLPDPVKRWARQIANAGSNVLSGGIRAQLNSIWQSRVLPVCRAAITNRYPFARGSASDVGLQDFARLFAPNGLIDSFFNEHLLPHVNIGPTTWTWKREPGKDLGISDAVLEAFQMAAQIRDAFFLQPGLPAITFDVKPRAVDPSAQKVVLEIDGQVLEYAHGPVVTTPMTWPGKAGGRTRISFMPEIPGVENQLSREGPWALFRLLDAARKGRTQVADEFNVTFTVGGRFAIFDLRAGSAFNPFDLPALDRFRCPQSL